MATIQRTYYNCDNPTCGNEVPESVEDITWDLGPAGAEVRRLDLCDTCQAPLKALYAVARKRAATSPATSTRPTVRRKQRAVPRQTDHPFARDEPPAVGLTVGDTSAGRPATEVPASASGGD